MKICMVSTLAALSVTLLLSGAQAPAPADKSAKQSSSYRGPMKDQTDTSDIFAIPLDNSEEDEREEEAALRAEAKRIQAKKLAKQEKKKAKEEMKKEAKDKAVP